MDKKDQLISFRLTEDNLNYLKQLAESDERSVSFVINKMIKAFRDRGAFVMDHIK